SLMADKTPTSENWDQLWRTVRNDSTALHMIHGRMLSVLEAELDVKGKKILEVGAGRGSDSAYLSRLGAEVTVIDFSEEACDQMGQVMEELGVDLNIVRGDASAMPFPDESFDAVFHAGFLEHFEDPGVMLKEQRRVLKPGGYLLVDVPQKYTFYTIKKKLAMARNKWFGGWETQFSPRQLERLVEHGGFKVLRSYGWGFTGSFPVLRRQGVRRLWMSIRRKGGGPNGAGGKLDAGGSESAAVTNEADSDPAISTVAMTGAMGQRRASLYVVDNVGVLAKKI
ncbi:MAG: class I SAM-dependent methyltransferase, partial [Thermoleophilia bacterium]|nr:class I SAM-dependent methyltransferase [Thermoleophilia bacterium]